MSINMIICFQNMHGQEDFHEMIYLFPICKCKWGKLMHKDKRIFLTPSIQPNLLGTVTSRHLSVLFEAKQFKAKLKRMGALLCTDTQFLSTQLVRQMMKRPHAISPTFHSSPAFDIHLTYISSEVVKHAFPNISILETPRSLKRLKVLEDTMVLNTGQY